MELLRNLIREIILESAETIESADSKGLALVEFEGYRGSSGLLLFDPRELEIFIDDNQETYPDSDVPMWVDPDFVDSELNSIVYGEIEIGDSRTSGYAYGAKEVYTSAARKGYGPLMYDIAMAYTGLLMSDRRSVSPQATNIWNKYSDRDDVSKLPLDDVQDPKTPEKVDDSEIFKSPNDKALNYAYKLKKESSIDVSKLLDRGDELVKKYGEEIKYVFKRLATGYFRSKYF